jgi:hypothetical protein
MLKSSSRTFSSRRRAVLGILLSVYFVVLVSRSRADTNTMKAPKGPPVVSGPQSDMFKPQKDRKRTKASGPKFYVPHPELVSVSAETRDGTCQPVGYGCGSCCTNGQTGSLWLNADCSWACDACTNGSACPESGPAYAEQAISLQSRSELPCVKMRPGPPGAFVLVNSCQTCMKVLLLWNYYNGSVKTEERALQAGQVQTVPLNTATRCETLSEHGC